MNHRDTETQRVRIVGIPTNPNPEALSSVPPRLRGKNYSPAFSLQPAVAKRRRGFSLLELLMAVTVLIIIVMIIALVFQQAHTAWGTGTRKAGAETTLRAIMGVIERDLTHAVDATQFGQANTFTEISGSDGTITFVTLDGTNRMPQQVQYTYTSSAGTLTRSIAQLIAGSSPSNWTVLASSPAACINGSQPLSAFAFHVIAAASTDVAPGLPQRVEIEAHLVKNGNFAVVSGWSLGRNRTGHPEDKIQASP